MFVSSHMVSFCGSWAIQCSPKISTLQSYIALHVVLCQNTIDTTALFIFHKSNWTKSFRQLNLCCMKCLNWEIRLIYLQSKCPPDKNLLIIQVIIEEVTAVPSIRQLRELERYLFPTGTQIKSTFFVLLSFGLQVVYTLRVGCNRSPISIS